MTGFAHSHLLRAVAILIVVPTALLAQVAFDVPVNPGLPAVFEGPSFSGDGGLAVSGSGRISYWTGLPDAPQHLTLVPVGDQTMTDHWYALSADTAVYRAAGLDGVGGTSDDPLMTVIGLPGSPVLVDTGLRGISADWTAVNANTAVRVDGGVFVVLRHQNGVATVETMPASSPLATGSGFAGGPVSTSAFAALAVGGDGQAGTSDDLIATLDVSGPTSVITETPLPAAAQPDGMVVSASGVVVTWRAMTLPVIRLTLGHDLAGTPTFSTLDVTPPANPSPGLAPLFGARRSGDDGVEVYCQDDLGPGEAHALVGDLSTTPTVLGGWYDDWNGGCASTVTSDSESIRYCASGGTSFEYNDLAAGVSHHVNAAFGPSPIAVDMPGRSLAVFTTAPSWVTGTGPIATATVFPDAHAPGLGHTFSCAGRWAGDGFDANGTYWPSRITRVTDGLIAGFVSSTGGAEIDVLRLVSVPSATMLGGGSAPGETHLELTSGMPGAASVIGLQLTAPAGAASTAWVFVAIERLEDPILLPSPAFAPMSYAFIDPASIAISVPLVIGVGNVGGTTFDITGLEALLAGQVFYVQGLAVDSAGVGRVTEALQLVLS